MEITPQLQKEFEEMLGEMSIPKTRKQWMISKLFTAYQKGVEAEKWIGVDERLPEECQIVLCFGVGNIPSMAMYGDTIFTRYIDHIPSDRNITIYYDKVTHWQELPKPPVK